MSSAFALFLPQIRAVPGASSMIDTVDPAAERPRLAERVSSELLSGIVEL